MGRDIYKGKQSSVETAARLGHPSPMILSLSHSNPFLPWCSTPELTGLSPSFFSLVCKVCRVVALQGEEGHLGIRGRLWGLHPTTPGNLADDE